MASDQGFGASSPGLWASLDPVGYLLRTSVLSVLEGWTGFVLTWRAKGTPSGRFWWVLGLSEPRTSGSGSGSLPAGMTAEGWPTPDASVMQEGDGTETFLARRERLKQTAANGNGMGVPLAMAVKLWPTATAKDEASSGAAGYSTESGRHPGTTLTDAANGLWARPQARDWKDSGPTQGARKSPNLGTQAHWPTPLSTPESPASHGQMSGNFRTAMDKALSFPSPKASDGRSKGTGGTPDHGLDAMARAGLLDQGSHSTSGKSRDSAEWGTPTSHERTHSPRPVDHGTQLANQVRGVLNSRWTLQLMGYPADWCDLPDGVIERLSRRSATQLSPLSLKRSVTRSSRRKVKHD